MTVLAVFIKNALKSEYFETQSELIPKITERS